MFPDVPSGVYDVIIYFELSTNLKQHFRYRRRLNAIPVSITTPYVDFEERMVTLMLERHHPNTSLDDIVVFRLVYSPCRPANTRR